MTERSRRLRVAAKIVATVAAAAAGAVTGVASTAVHDKNWAWFLLAVAAPAAAAWALPAGWLRIGFTTGWIALVLVAVQGTTAGSYAVAADLRGYLYLGSGLLLMVVAIVSLPTPRRRPRLRVESETGASTS